jgi:hypothetical protein
MARNPDSADSGNTAVVAIVVLVLVAIVAFFLLFRPGTNDTAPGQPDIDIQVDPPAQQQNDATPAPLPPEEAAAS